MKDNLKKYLIVSLCTVFYVIWLITGGNVSIPSSNKIKMDPLESIYARSTTPEEDMQNVWDGVDDFFFLAIEVALGGTTDSQLKYSLNRLVAVHGPLSNDLHNTADSLFFFSYQSGGFLVSYSLSIVFFITIWITSLIDKNKQNKKQQNMHKLLSENKLTSNAYKEKLDVTEKLILDKKKDQKRIQKIIRNKSKGYVDQDQEAEIVKLIDEIDLIKANIDEYRERFKEQCKELLNVIYEDNRKQEFENKRANIISAHKAGILSKEEMENKIDEMEDAKNNHMKDN